MTSSGIAVAGQVVDGGGGLPVGVGINGSQEGVISGAVIRNLDPIGYGIALTETGTLPSNWLISDCYIESAHHGLYVNGDVDTVVLRDSLIVADGSPTTAGLQVIANSAALTKLVVQGCTFVGWDAVGVGAIRVTGAFTFSDVIIKDNNYFDCADPPVTTTGTFDNTCLIETSSEMLTKAGAPSDADFLYAPRNGTLALDSSNHRLYVRDGGAWKYAGLT